MEDPPLKLDDEGIPVLDYVVGPDTGSDQPETNGPDLTNHEIIEQLLGKEHINQLIDDLTDDLQKLVSWKIETVLKEELATLIHTATEQGSEKLGEDIRTQLRLALPELIAQVARKNPEE